MGELLFGELTEKIIGAAYNVHNALGPNLTEKPYEMALAMQLRSMGFAVEVQKTVPLIFDKNQVGVQRIDIVVEKTIIVETKAVRTINAEYLRKLLTTLRNTGYPLGLLINFGPSVQVRRVINSMRRTADDPSKGNT